MSTLWEILTYNDSIVDIVLNYTALAASFIPLIVTLNPLKSSLRGRYFWIPLSVYLTGFQIILCMRDGCVGISIIWCSYCGFNMVAYKSLSSRKDLKPKYAQKYRFLPTVLKASLAYCGAVCVYYAVVEEPISTVAHACALAMGGFIGYFFTRSTDDVASDGLKHDIERKPK